MKKIFKFIKKFIISIFILYGYNLIASPLGIIIPINIFTILITTILGIPAIFALITIIVLLY